MNGHFEKAVGLMGDIWLSPDREGGPDFAKAVSFYERALDARIITKEPKISLFWIYAAGPEISRNGNKALKLLEQPEPVKWWPHNTSVTEKNTTKTALLQQLMRPRVISIQRKNTRQRKYVD